MLKLSLVADQGSTPLGRALGRTPLYIGRAPTNDVVLDHRSVSGRHASIWVVRGEVWIEDLGSRNGTFRANGTRIRNPVKIGVGEPIRLGTEVQLVVEGEAPPVHTGPLVVALADGSSAFTIKGNRFVFGPEPGADVVLAEDAATVVLTLHPDGELWLGSDESEGPIGFEERFEVGGRAYVVRGSRLHVSATWDVEHERYPYRLTASLNGQLGPEATLTHLRTGQEHAIRGANRAVLLYVLAKQLVEDRDEGEPVTHAGWVPDAAAAQQIWGRQGANKNLNVLVTRVRNELKEAGLNPWFIEKRSGSTRIQLDDVDLDD